MKYLLIICMSLLLTGCGNPLTRLLPKLDKIELPEELMVPAKELKTIKKPETPPIDTPQAELTRDVPPIRN
jgi:hypothetical protein